MSLSGTIPALLFTVVAAAAIFTVMLDVGLGIEIGEFRARALFAVLIAVPALALLVGQAFDVPRDAEIGIVLMAISPGAPVALRRSLGAGGHRSFAPALQILVALVAVASMPLWIAALNEVYAGSASISPGRLARQVLVAQLMPLALGIVIRRTAPLLTARFEPLIYRLGTLLLILLLVLALIDVAPVVVESGPRVALAVVCITALAIAVGHLLGGPEPATRTAVAISSAARNAGLALLVATLNPAPPAVGRTVLVYVVISAFTLIPYVIWRRRAGHVAGGGHEQNATAE